MNDEDDALVAARRLTVLRMKLQRTKGNVAVRRFDDLRMRSSGYCTLQELAVEHANGSDRRYEIACDRLVSLAPEPLPTQVIYMQESGARVPVSGGGLVGIALKNEEVLRHCWILTSAMPLWRDWIAANMRRRKPTPIPARIRRPPPVSEKKLNDWYRKHRAGKGIPPTEAEDTAAILKQFGDVPRQRIRSIRDSHYGPQKRGKRDRRRPGTGSSK